MKLNFNSILMFVMLAVLGWLGTETRNTALGLAELRISQDLVIKQNSESFTRVEEHLKASIPRNEFDMKIVGLEAQIAEIKVRLREFDVFMQQQRDKGIRR